MSDIVTTNSDAAAFQAFMLGATCVATVYFITAMA